MLRNILFLFFSSTSLYSLPEAGIVASGHAEFAREGPNSLKITVTDQTILNYPSFNIGTGETVEFIQPHSSSCVLNRVTGGHESEILGTLSANGRVFLVNPQGIYFGKEAQVNVGGIVASTLNIKDGDFLARSYTFFLEPGSEQGQIMNEGVLSCSDLGFVALLAPKIHNQGAILAKAEKVLLASGERIALDVTGDGLIQFSVEGAIKDALIENYGQIEASGGSVTLAMPAARQAIKMVVNTDGLTADAMEEENGVIRLVRKSQITARTVTLNGDFVDVQGTIDATNPSGHGGTVRLLGNEVQLWGATIDASGETGGGKILIGGNYQGKGPERNSQKTIVDELTSLTSDAYTVGDGGTIIAWSDGQTLFGATTHARGGVLGGNGGLVETSGSEYLFVAESTRVDTSAPLGTYGTWLLDPASINVATGGTGTLADATTNCGNALAVTIAPATINAAVSNVALCAQNAAGSTITVTNAISMTNAGVSLSFTAGSGNVGTIILKAGITTKGASVSFTGLVSLQFADCGVDTTAGGTFPAGGNISFSNTVNRGIAYAGLGLAGGTNGTMTFSGTIGGSSPVSYFDARGGALVLSSTLTVVNHIVLVANTSSSIAGNITSTTNGYIYLASGPTTLTGSAIFTTSANNGLTLYTSIDGPYSLTLTTGTGPIIFGPIGNTNPLTNFVMTNNTSSITILGNITLTGANPLSFPPSAPITLGADCTITNNNNITFNNTVNGAFSLATSSSGSTTRFVSAIGGTTPLTSVTATAIGGTITQSSSVKTTAGVGYGAAAININGNITTTGGAITITGPVTISNNPTIDSSAGNQNITFSGPTSTINGALILTLNAGTGTITFGGALGGITPLTSLTVGGGTITQSSSVRTTNGVGYGATTINIGGNITTTGAAITITGAVNLSNTPTFDTSGGNKNIIFSGSGSTINGATTLTLTSGTGTITLGGEVGGITPLTSVTATAIGGTITQSSSVRTTLGVGYGAAAINIGGNITTTGGAITITGPVTISNNPTIDSSAGNQNITFSGPTSTINGATTLTLTSGTGTITFGGAVGGSTALTALTVTAIGGTITQSSSVKTTAGVGYGAAAINIAGNITTTGGAITITGPVTISNNLTIDSSAGNQNITFSGGTSTINGALILTLNAGTGTITFGGALGGITPLTSLTVGGGTITQSSSVTTTNGVGYGATAVNIGGNITTTGAAITITGSVTLSNAPVFNTSGGNQNIIFSGAGSTINGATTLTLTSGTGTITFGGAVGGSTALTSLTVTAIGGTINQNDSVKTTGAINYTGSTAINIKGNMTTAGGAIGCTGPVFLTNTPLLDTTNSGGTTTGANVTFSTTVDGAAALSINAGTNGTATFSGAVGASTPLSAFTASGNTVTLANIGNAGTLAAGVSGTTSVTASPNSVTFTGTAYYANTQTYSSPSNFFLNAGALTSFTTNGNPISFTNAGVIQLSAGTDLTITTSNGTLSTDSIDAATGDLRTLTLNGGTGTVSVGAIGTASANEFFSVVITSGTLNLTGNIVTQAITLPAAAAYTIYLGGSITTANNPIAFHRAVTINTTPTVTLTAGNGAISFDNTLDGDIPYTRSLTLETTGAVTFSANVGANFPLGDMLFSSVGDITASGSIFATSMTETAGTGTASFNGIMTTGVSGINLVGSIYTFNGAVNTATGAGPVTITNSGALTINPGAAFTVGGSFTQNGSSTSNSVADNITTNNGPLSFLRTVTIAGTPTFDSGNTNQDITFFSSVTVDADITRTLTLNAGLGAISCLGTIGDATHRLGTLAISSGALSASAAVHAMALTQAAGSAQFDSTLTTYAPGTNLSLTGSTYTFSDVVDTGPGAVQITNSGTNSINAPFIVGTSFTQNGAGANSVGANITTTNGSISFLSAITLTANTITMDSSGGSGTIGLASTIDSDFVTPRSLTLTADSGAITLGGVLGAIQPLNVLTIASAGGVTANGAISAASITQTTGTGISAFNGALTTTDGSGITLIGPACTFGGLVNTLTGSGPVTITNNAGLCTINAPFTVGGTFIQNGMGLNAIGADITTTSGAIAFSTTIQLTNAVTMDTTNGNASSGANILFSGSLEDSVPGGHSLSLRAGTGDISFSSAVGGVVPLGDIIISSANNVSAPPTLENSAFLLTGGTGTATLYDMGTNSDWLNTVDVSSNNIVICGVIYATQSNFVATGSIQNCNNSAEVHTIQPVTFNAFGGNVGSEAIPINIDAANQVTVGSTYLADFNGTTGDGTIHNDLLNPPCVVIFNGVTIYNCHPTPPPPPHPPSPPVSTSNKAVFPAPDFDSSFFNLASDFDFLTIFLGQDPYEMGPVRSYCFKPDLNLNVSQREKPFETQYSMGISTGRRWHDSQRPFKPSLCCDLQWRHHL